MAHLRWTISLGIREVFWVDADQHRDLLSHEGAEQLGFNFKDTTDVLVTERMSSRIRQPWLNMRLLFRAKKEVEDHDIIKVQASVLLANIRSEDTKPVMVSWSLA